MSVAHIGGSSFGEAGTNIPAFVVLGSLYMSPERAANLVGEVVTLNGGHALQLVAELGRNSCGHSGVVHHRQPN